MAVRSPLEKAVFLNMKGFLMNSQDAEITDKYDNYYLPINASIEILIVIAEEVGLVVVGVQEVLIVNFIYHK